MLLYSIQEVIKMDQVIKNQAIKYSKHFTAICDVCCVPVDYLNKSFILDDTKKHEFCGKCTQQKCDGINVFLYGCHEAYRWDGMYIYHCPLGFILVASSISNDEGALVGGIVAGPINMGNIEDILLETPSEELDACIEKLTIMTPSKVRSLSVLMAGITSSISGTTHGKAGRYFYSQEKLLNTLYAEKLKFVAEGEYYTYPIASERKLRAAVRNRDKEGSQILLNQILAYIYVSNNSDLEAIKPRITELIVVISRAAVDAGADINEIFHLNHNFISHINEFKTIEELSAWVSNMLHRFISFTFDFAEIKHADVVYKTIEYIKQNYSKRLTLEKIAESTYLSKTYLSSVFKRETGHSISSYINLVRVENSKSMLLEDNMSIIDIANACGFEDQSYYTKVFKSIIGITPKKYRENRGKGGLKEKYDGS